MESATKSGVSNVRTTKSLAAQPCSPKSDRWLYAAAGAAALAATGAADAAIITDSNLYQPAGRSGASFQVDGAREVEFAGQLLASGTGNGLVRLANSDRLGGSLKLFVNKSSVEKFAGGAPIGGKQTATHGIVHTQYVIANFSNSTFGNGARGQFPGTGSGFAGFKLPNGDLGWLFINVGTGGQNMTIDSYAYNDVPGAPIDAGQTVSVPEPSALGLLAMGSAGVLAWRRRRQNADPVSSTK